MAGPVLEECSAPELASGRDVGRGSEGMEVSLWLPVDRCDARRCLNLKSLMVSNITEQAPNLILFAKQNQSLSHPTLVFFQGVCDRALAARHSGVGPAYRAPGTSPLN